MPKYRVLETSFINDEIVFPGTIVDFVGIPSPHLELVDQSQALAIEKANIQALRDELQRRFDVTAPANADIAELQWLIQGECLRDTLSDFVNWPQGLPQTEKSVKASTAAQLETQALLSQARG